MEKAVWTTGREAHMTDIVERLRAADLITDRDAYRSGNLSLPLLLRRAENDIR